MTPLTVASFFSGVGLLDLGLEWAGFRTVSVSEVNPYANRILSLRYPDAPNLGDLHGITDVPQATLWAGGFPCQPVSTAGKRRAQDDDRWLWPVWVRLIRDLRPPYLLLENVANLLVANGGRAFGEVLGDLAASGYDAEWDCIPAAALGAPHLRDRVWIMGRDTHRDLETAFGGVLRGQAADTCGGVTVPDPERIGVRQQPELVTGGSRPALAGHDGTAGPMADTAGAGEGGLHLRPGRPFTTTLDTDRARLVWRLPQPDPRRHGSGDGWWGAEPGMGRVVDGVPHRVDRLRCLGNGVVPQVAEFIGWRLRAVIESRAAETAA